MIKSFFKTINKAMFSHIFKCNHDFIYYCCTPQRRYCKKCQLSQVFIDTWVDLDSQKAISKMNDSQKELDLEKRELRKVEELMQEVQAELNAWRTIN